MHSPFCKQLIVTIRFYYVYGSCIFISSIGFNFIKIKKKSGQKIKSIDKYYNAYYNAYYDDDTHWREYERELRISGSIYKNRTGEY